MFYPPTFDQVWAQSYSGTQFIEPIWGLIPNPRLSPDPAGYWEGELCGSCGIPTSQLWLWSGRWPIRVHMKWVYWVFLPWIHSNSRVWLDNPCQVCHPTRGQTEKDVSIDRGSAYRYCPYFTYPNKPGAYTLNHTCRHRRALHVLCYPRTMTIHPYPLFGVIYHYSK